MAGKTLLLRVGIDRGAGGALGPIFRDGRFEYVPIPETAATRSTVTYAALSGRHVSSLAEVLPPRLAVRKPHLDPDFAAAIYGDAALGKRRQLLRLSRGDLIVFYAGLAPSPPEDRPRLFAIGSLRVVRVHDLRGGALSRPDLMARFGGTAHFLREPADRELALVEGEGGQTAMFPRAIPLGDGQDKVLPDLARMGYQGSLLRSVGHWIEGADRQAFFEAWLRTGPASLVDHASRLLPLDASLEPPKPDGTLTLQLPGARVGDWFITTIGSARSLSRRAFGRINRIDAGGAAAHASLFWLFLGQGLSQTTPLLGAAGHGRAPLGAAAVRRLASWLHAHLRIGIHRSADGDPASVPDAVDA